MRGDREYRRELERLAREYGFDVPKRTDQKKCTVCGQSVRVHQGKLPFSSAQESFGFRVDFRWPQDLCECCALMNGMEDYCAMVLLP